MKISASPLFNYYQIGESIHGVFTVPRPARRIINSIKDPAQVRAGDRTATDL
jgi:hypothetical protein